MKLKYLLITLLFTALSQGKNLSILSTGHLDNYELLDVFIYNHEGSDYAFIPGGLGGLNIVHIDEPEEPDVVGQYFASGCDYGRIYAWSAKGNYAFGSGRECGIHVINLSDIQNPEHVTTVREVVDGETVRYEHTEIEGNLIFASRHQHGIEILDFSTPSDPITQSVIQTENTWATLADGNILYAADGGFGLKIIDISEPSFPVTISEYSTNGTAKDLAKSGDFLFIAVGAGGVDMFDVSDPTNPVFLSNYNTSGYASRVASNDSIVAVSDWDDVEILSFSGGILELVGYKNTGGRVMALAMKNNIIYSAEWMNFVVFEYGQVENADLDFSTKIISFPRVNSGSSMTQIFTLENNGLLPLNIANINIDVSDFHLDMNPDLILPGDSRTATITYSPEGNVWRSYVEIYSNDHDEELSRVKVTGNFPYGPMPGDTAPGFTLPIVNGEGDLSLSDLIGNPTVIAFFTGW